MIINVINMIKCGSDIRVWQGFLGKMSTVSLMVGYGHPTINGIPQGMGTEKPLALHWGIPSLNVG